MLSASRQFDSGQSDNVQFDSNAFCLKLFEFRENDHIPVFPVSEYTIIDVNSDSKKFDFLVRKSNISKNKSKIGLWIIPVWEI